MDYPNFHGAGGDGGGGSSASTYSRAAAAGYRQQQQQQHPYDFVDSNNAYDDARGVLGATAGANTTMTPTTQEHHHFHHQHQQQPTAAAAAAAAAAGVHNNMNSPLWLQVEQENQLLRQRLQEVQAQMEATQKEKEDYIIIQQQEEERKRPAAVVQNNSNSKRKKQRRPAVPLPVAAAAAAAAAAMPEEETESEEEEEDDDDSSNSGDNDNSNNGDDDEEKDSPKHPPSTSWPRNNNKNKGTPPPIYGRRQDPIKTSYGLIDGRSNAQQAFEEKCQMLRDYIAETGHANVPTPQNKNLPKKWQLLSRWVEKQYKFYRGLKNMGTTKHLGGSMTWERAAILKEIGLNLDARTSTDEVVHQFHHVYYPQLVAFHKQWGHTCVSAVENVHGADKLPSEGLKKWVSTNRVFLRNAKAHDRWLQQQQQQQQQQAQDGGGSDRSGGENETSTTTAAGDGAGQDGNDSSKQPMDGDTTTNNNNNASNNDNDKNGAEAASFTNVNDKPDSSSTNNDKGLEQQVQKEGSQWQPQAQEEGGGAGNDNSNQKDISNNNTSAESSTTKKRKERRRECAERKRSYWTDEMTQKLTSLNCPWMNEVAETEMKAYLAELHQLPLDESSKAKKKQRKKLSFVHIPVQNSTTWYENFEHFRKYVQEHDGNGLVDVSVPINSLQGIKYRLNRFVRDQRKLYDAIQAGIAPKHPILEQNFAMLQSIGFVFDAEILKQEEERKLRLKMEQARAEKEKDSPFVKLERDRQAAQEAKAQVAVAKAAVTEAQQALAKAQRAAQVANKVVRDQEDVIANNPLGKIVVVKSRGDTKPGGRAKVLGINKVKILNENVTFYDVEYVDDSSEKDKEAANGDDDKDRNEEEDERQKAPKKEFGVEGMWVTFEDPRFNGGSSNDSSVPQQPTVQQEEEVPVGPRRSRRQQQRSNVVASTFHRLMLPPQVPGQATDDYEDGMSVCI